MFFLLLNKQFIIRATLAFCQANNVGLEYSAKFDNNMYFLGGSGEIYLNTEETTEPLVRGETLLGLMEELIDAINVQVFQTPCGPTAPGPTNKPTFNQIKSKLNTFLSTLNIPIGKSLV